VAKVKATAKLHEWQTDSLASATSNKVAEGFAIDGAALTATSRINNYCQISVKAVTIAGTTQSSEAAGRSSEMSYQIAKAGRELKRDMEFTLTRNQAGTAGGIATARQLASVESWLSTNNTHLGTAGTTPGYASSVPPVAPTDSSATVTLTEGHLKTVIGDIWNAGGNPEVIMVGKTTKQDISGFSGIATLYNLTNDAQGTIIGGADLYVSDFGKHTVVPNRFSRDQTALILDMSMWAVAFLRPMHTVDLAKTGDATNKAIIAEYTLEARNEASSGKIADVA